jgi:hypothetical protein
MVAGYDNAGYFPYLMNTLARISAIPDQVASAEVGVNTIVAKGRLYGFQRFKVSVHVGKDTVTHPPSDECIKTVS